jgi:glucosyl-dolichyl phosphate glucuronosyltransferase
MRISVIIPTRNRPELLKQALQSVITVDFPQDEYELIVIDNGSTTDDTRKITETLIRINSNIRYVHEPNLGLHYARNTGALAAKAEILAYLDDDVIVDKNWLSEIVEAFDDQKVGCAGGPIVPLWQTKPPTWLQYYTPALWSAVHYGDVARYLNEDEEIYGANYAIRRRLVLEHQGFSPDSVGKRRIGDGETGLLNWVHQRGWRVAYRPQASVFHIMPASRTTEKYVVNRLYTQGGCDSYTYIRAEKPSWIYLWGQVLKLWLKSARHWVLMKRHQGSRKQLYYEHLGTYAYQYGAAAYRWFVLTDPEFRSFVYRDNWLDNSHV